MPARSKRPSAIGQDDLDGAAALYDHARPVLDAERQAILDKRFTQAREVAVYRDIDRDLAGLPLDPAAPPGLDIFESRAAELVPEGATDAVRAGIAQVAASAHRHAERQWHRRQAIAEGRIDPDLARYDRLRLGIDRTLEVRGIDTHGPAATKARAAARHELKSFEIIEGRPPVGADLDDIVRRAVDGVVPQARESPPVESTPVETPSPNSESSTGSVMRVSPAPDDEESAEQQPEPSILADSEEDDEPVAGTAPDGNDNGSIGPDVESTDTATPDSSPTEDGAPPPFADDPNVIRVGGGSNSSRRAGGGRPLTRNEETRAANFQSTLNAIRELEPNNRELTSIKSRDWVPSQSDIARVQEELLRAKARAAGEMSAVPIGGYAGESIPAGSPGRRFTSEERRQINRIGSELGCHSCGAIGSGTPSGNWVPDHQPPSALHRPGEPQRLYPQCISCSRQQGGEVNRLKKEGAER